MGNSFKPTNAFKGNGYRFQTRDELKQADRQKTKPKKEMKPGDLFNKFQEMKKKKTMKKNWIANAIKKPGALHKALGVPEGKKIPGKKLEAAAKKGGKMGKRARLAETLKSFHHKKRKKMSEVQDRAYDKKHGLKEGSKKDLAQDKRMGVKQKMACKMHKKVMCKKCM